MGAPKEIIVTEYFCNVFGRCNEGEILYLSDTGFYRHLDGKTATGHDSYFFKYNTKPFNPNIFETEE